MDLDDSLSAMRTFAERVMESIPPGSDSLRAAWRTYSNEAIWGRIYLDEEIQRLPPGSRVIEIGAGPLFLSWQLASEGFRVTALEPVSLGFVTMDALGSLVSQHFDDRGLELTRVTTKAEALTLCDQFDFAYSINVLEHVDDVELALTRVLNSLRPGGSMRFRCPNYSFPYEPHFGWIVPPSKRAASRLYSKRIEASTLEDAEGMWRSLNWVSVKRLSTWAEARQDVDIVFNPDALHEIWGRVQADPVLRRRHEGPLVAGLHLAEKLGLGELLRLVPVTMQPVIDGRMTRTA